MEFLLTSTSTSNLDHCIVFTTMALTVNLPPYGPVEERQAPWRESLLMCQWPQCISGLNMLDVAWMSNCFCLFLILYLSFFVQITCDKSPMSTVYIFALVCIVVPLAVVFAWHGSRASEEVGRVESSTGKIARHKTYNLHKELFQRMMNKYECEPVSFARSCCFGADEGCGRRSGAVHMSKSQITLKITTHTCPKCSKTVDIGGSCTTWEWKKLYKEQDTMNVSTT